MYSYTDSTAECNAMGAWTQCNGSSISLMSESERDVMEMTGAADEPAFNAGKQFSGLAAR